MWWKILLTIAEEMEEPWYETISRIISIYVGLLIRRLTAGLIDVDKFLEKLVKEMALILINEKGMSMIQSEYSLCL